jgi:hypothetical protein
MQRRGPLWLVGLAMLVASPLWGAEPTPMRADAQGLSLTATPLSTANKTAFLLARGFRAEAIASYAQACGFSFAFENRQRQGLVSRLADWSVEADGRVLRFVLPETWDKEWRRQEINDPARIAVRWAQFPAEQEFAQGDWIMGMANLTERPAGKFRLIARFTEGEKHLELSIDPVVCPPLD